MSMAPVTGAQTEGAGPSSTGLPPTFLADPDQPALPSATSSAPSSASLSPEYFTPTAGRFGRPPGTTVAQLSGPGIPGPSSEPVIIGPAPRGRSVGPRPRRGSIRSSSRYPDPYPRASVAGEGLEPHRLTPRPTRSLPPASLPLQEDDGFPITLPPLMLSRSPTPDAQSVPGSSTGPHRRVRSPLASGSRVSRHVGRPSQSFGEAESSFALHSPVSHIPPPFTLQPSPLWDDPAFSPFNPPSSSSRPGSSYRPGSSHSLSLSQAHLPSPTHHTPGFTTTTTSPTALPSLTNLFHEGAAGAPHSDVTLAPIRTRFDVVRQAVSPRETNLPQSSPTTRLPPRPGASAAPPGPSRSRDDDESEDRRDVHQPSPY